MTTLVVGASGATGKMLVEQLLKNGQRVKAIVRATSRIPDIWNNNNQLTVIKENVSEITVDEMSEYAADCQSFGCCLGHNMTWKGIYGKPRRLVRDAVVLICEAVKNNAPKKPVRFVLMNTTGNRNRDVAENISVGEKIVLGLVRALLPPHPDNEEAADYLRVKIGHKNPYIEWVVVRPDTLINAEEVTEYTLHPSPTRSAIFNPGKTSRINVGDVMAKLMLDDDFCQKWKGQMPVVYNKSSR